MATITHSHTVRPEFFGGAAGGSGVIPGSVAVLLVATIIVAVWTSPALILPVMALVSTGLATIAGIAGWSGSGRLRSGLLMSAGVFALAAAAAAMLGDANLVAVLMR